MTLNEIPNAFDEKFEASHNTAGIERRTKAPNGRLKLNNVILKITRSNIFAVANGAIAKASLT